MDKELGNEPKSPDGLALAASLLAALGTTEQEITDTWVAASNPPTQLLGRAAYDSGRIAGIKYPLRQTPRWIEPGGFLRPPFDCDGQFC